DDISATARYYLLRRLILAESKNNAADHIADTSRVGAAIPGRLTPTVLPGWHCYIRRRVIPASPNAGLRPHNASHPLPGAGRGGAPGRETDWPFNAAGFPDNRPDHASFAPGQRLVDRRTSSG